jgi:signal transduction histidine kinase
VARSGQTALVPDTSREPAFLEVDFMPPMLSQLCVPVKIDGEVIAVLNVESRWPNAFDEADVAALETLSGQVAVALRNSKLMEEVQQKATELEKANAELRRLDEMKADFVSMLVHDLRTPMTGILGSSEIIEELLLGEVDERIMNLVRIIPKESKRLIDLINNILDFYRLEDTGIKVAPAPLAVETLLREAYEGAKVIADKQKVEFAVTVEPGLPMVKGDEAKLLQVLSNLVGNALKFTPDGGEVTISAQAADGMVAISISDTGVGIPQDEIPHLFEKFKTFRTASDRRVRGSGLGLYIARAIVEAHGGTISVESEQGKGSTFVFTVPAVTGT